MADTLTPADLDRRDAEIPYGLELYGDELAVLVGMARRMMRLEAAAKSLDAWWGTCPAAHEEHGEMFRDMMNDLRLALLEKPDAD